MESRISVRILGIPGSLRKDSFNMALLRAASDLLVSGATLEIFGLDGIPVFNQDEEKKAPARVTEFKSKIRQADALLFATPEYNYSIPGVLKNAIDWASRPYGDNPFHGKPAAMMSASKGVHGGVRAQYHLRQVMVFLDMHPIAGPEVALGFAHEKIDSMGRLVDESSREFVGQLVQELVLWTRLLKAGEDVLKRERPVVVSSPAPTIRNYLAMGIVED